MVLDDHSDDATADVVLAMMERDHRVRFLEGQPLPDGWCGKQFACSILSRAARHSLLVFLDADVRLAPDGLARITTYLEESRADLVSGIPRQETGTLVEKLVIPLIHFVLLGFLPLARMRRYRHPAYAAGCGQLFLAGARPTKQQGAIPPSRPPFTMGSPCREPSARRACGPTSAT